MVSCERKVRGLVCCGCFEVMFYFHFLEEYAFAGWEVLVECHDANYVQLDEHVFRRSNLIWRNLPSSIIHVNRFGNLIRSNTLNQI